LGERVFFFDRVLGVGEGEKSFSEVFGVGGQLEKINFAKKRKSPTQDKKRGLELGPIPFFPANFGTQTRFPVGEKERSNKISLEFKGPFIPEGKIRGGKTF